MTQLQADKAAIIAEHRTHETDTGSCEVQVSILTHRIRALTEHLKVHKKDNHTRRGLMMLVGRRGRLLRYLKKQDESRYTDLIQGLGIRGIRTRA